MRTEDADAGPLQPPAWIWWVAVGFGIIGIITARAAWRDTAAYPGQTHAGPILILACASRLPFACVIGLIVWLCARLTVRISGQSSRVLGVSGTYLPSGNVHLCPTHYDNVFAQLPRP